MIFNVKKEDWYKAGVYCITNLLNNKIYIGSTSQHFYIRFHQHKSDYKQGKRDIRVLYRAFDRYGFDNFEFKILCICQKEDCIKMEQFYIDKGSDYNCAMIAGSLLGLKHLPNSKTRTVKGGLHHCAKKIDQYTKDGIFIKTHNSIIEACVSVGKGKNNSSHISGCCVGQMFSSAGFRWSLHGKPLPDRFDKKLGVIIARKSGSGYGKPIIAIEKNTNIKTVFPSIAEAGRKLNVYPSTISSNLAGRTKFVNTLNTKYKFIYNL